MKDKTSSSSTLFSFAAGSKGRKSVAAAEHRKFVVSLLRLIEVQAAVRDPII